MMNDDDARFRLVDPCRCTGISTLTSSTNPFRSSVLQTIMSVSIVPSSWLFFYWGEGGGAIRNVMFTHTKCFMHKVSISTSILDTIHILVTSTIFRQPPGRASYIINKQTMVLYLFLQYLGMIATNFLTNKQKIFNSTSEI